MNEPLTEQLLDELLSSSSVEEFIGSNDLRTQSLPDYLAQMLKEKGLAQSKTVRAAGISPTYGYQIFKGERKPSREKLLAIALAMRLNLRETNRLLQIGEANGLYAKNRRDAIIIFCIDHQRSLAETNTALYEFGERTIDQQ